MRNWVHATAIAFIAALLFSAMPAGSASACDLSDEYRQMNGVVAAVSGGKLTLTQRGGDKVAFKKASGVDVMGARSAWSAIAAGDRAIIAWRISDSPAIAHQVCILPGS